MTKTFHGDDARRQLNEAIQYANIPTLLAVLFQVTGDETWLSDRYPIRRPRGMDGNYDGGLSPGLEREIRSDAVKVLSEWMTTGEVAISSPGPAQLERLMSFVMGEPVGPEYARFARADLGLDADLHGNPEIGGFGDFTVAVIGAGISGILASRALQRLGIKHTVYEKNAETGGTWLENRYPGAGVDTPSHLYSFSFATRSWSTHFGKRDEVLEYVQATAADSNVYDFTQFETEVTRAEFDSSDDEWILSLKRNGSESVVRANAIVTAVGQLNRPSVPDLPGIDTFEGLAFHSAHWPEGLDLRGKRVAVVGSGASAMQIVPAIADDVGSLTVFQRSPQWIAPNDDYFKPIPEALHWLMENVPLYQKWYRLRLGWVNNDKVHPSLQIDETWQDGARSINAQNEGHRAFFERYLREELEGRPDLIDKCLPTYPPFGKRMLLDNGWFRALREPHVELVADKVAGFTANGLRQADGTEHQFDVVILATGFQADRLLHPMEVVNGDGVTLREVWGEHDATAYLGIAVPSFPNFFMMYGPNTNLGHGGSYITIGEFQINYISDLLTKMVRKRLSAVDCKPEVCDSYVRRLDAAHEKMIWSHRGMDTWYRNAAGRVVANMPWRIVDYWDMTQVADLDDFEVR